MSTVTTYSTLAINLCKEQPFLSLLSVSVQPTLIFKFSRSYLWVDGRVAVLGLSFFFKLLGHLCRDSIKMGAYDDHRTTRSSKLRQVEREGVGGGRR